MGKDFKKKAAGAQPVYSTIIGSAQDTQEDLLVQEEYDTHQEQEVRGTQGRKGAKLPRINMAFSQENLDYLRVMAGIRGQSVTRYVNVLVELDMKKNREVYETARKLSEGL